MLGDQEVEMAERYLINVWNGLRSKTDARTFDQLRLEYRRKTPAIPLEKYPPTSSVIREHLKRGHYVIRKFLTLLSYGPKLNPVGNSWYVYDEYPFRTVGLNQFPDKIMSICGCGGKCKGQCSCYKNGQKCIIFCHKDSGDNCTNKL